MPEHEILDLDALETPVYRINSGGKPYDFDPMLMAIELDRQDMTSGDLGKFHEAVKAVLEAGKISEAPKLTLTQAIAVMEDFTSYFEGVQKKIQSSLGLRDSTDTKQDERWRQVQASAQKNTDSASSSTSMPLEQTESSTTTEPSEQSATLE